jgi:RNA polymerase sigma-70 factor (ECF subfamily)
MDASEQRMLAASSVPHRVTSMNEASLVAGAKCGETGALDALYHAHAPRLLRTAHQITRNHEDAEDAVQDSFLNALRYLKSFDGRSTFSTWLTRIGINSALMILRKKCKSREISAYGSTKDEPMWEVSDSGPNPEARYAQRERDRLLRSAVHSLRPRIRRALELHAFHDNSLEETALQLGISVSAAKARVFRAKAVLRKSKVLRNISDCRWHRPRFDSGE